MIHNTLINNRAYGLISEEGLKHVKTPCTISYTMTTSNMSVTKTFPIVEEDMTKERIAQIAVYGTRQVLGASLLRRYEDNDDKGWDLQKCTTNMTLVHQQRESYCKTFQWKFVYFVDKMRDKIVDLLLRY